MRLDTAATEAAEHLVFSEEPIAHKTDSEQAAHKDDSKKHADEQESKKTL